ncbi:hypothetical protein MTO96_004622 [Rhipicephalus appendiculatus]
MSFPGLAPPPFFLATPGRPPLPWEQWEQMFNVYLVASGTAEFTPERRKAILCSASWRPQSAGSGAGRRRSVESGQGESLEQTQWVYLHFHRSYLCRSFQFRCHSLLGYNLPYRSGHLLAYCNLPCRSRCPLA